MTILYVLLAILLLGVLITAHEFGHFIASRLCGIAVKEFSIGFGPLLWQKKSKKHDTVFSLRPIPLGGYCMFYGDGEDDTKDDPRNYNNAAVWKRMISVVSGPLMNFVLAFVVAVALMAAYGVVAAAPLITQVETGMPAESAGLLPGDVFVSVNSQNVTELSTEEVSTLIGKTAASAPVEITVLRDGTEKSFMVSPLYDAELQRSRVGITIQQGFAPMSAGQIVPSAWSVCKQASVAIVNALGKLFTTGEGLDQTSGPVGVVQMVAEETRQGGLEIYLYLIVIISINLGLMNLLPIPGLDGSRLVFMLIEAVRRKPVNQRIESMVHLCGYVFLFGLMLFFTYKDVLHLFGA